MRIGPGYRYCWLCLVAGVTPRSLTRAGLSALRGLLRIRAWRLCPGEGQSGAQGERSEHRKVAPESLTSTPTATAAQAPIRPARANGAGRARRRSGATGDPATAITGDDDPEEGVAGRLGEIVRGELEAALRDVGEVARTAGVEHRARQVRVAARDQVDQGERGQGDQGGGDQGHARDAAERAERSGRPEANGFETAATAAPPTGQHDRGADVGPEAARCEDQRRQAPPAERNAPTAARRVDRFPGRRTRSGPPRPPREPSPRSAPRARCRSRRSGRRRSDSARAARAWSARSRRSRRSRTRSP